MIEQERGRALWWDKPQKLQQQKIDEASTVPQKPYYYDVDH